ncbi:PelA/Pel-15E family pectate lyase [Sphingomonas insulae]|uniref:Pectate lyase n=1 Tax=Sphingomonas insulae TaxID=424800 RepID=A0ABN1I042_9SPHN|nr:pectate lyase [Sphingomonas insulae]NIJ30513.1 PelA/Pel-15E family pectate lyase [Sphingomonas insulae]
MRTAFLACVMATVAMPVAAAVVGHMTPPPSLTAERLSGLAPTARRTWADYIARSTAAMARDKAALAAERRGLATIPPPPPEGKTASMPLDRDAGWYAGDAAREIANNIVSFQTPTGGWGKNQDRSGPSRAPGQMYLPFDSKAGTYAAADLAGGWSFVGTLDNDATTTEMAFLARAQAGRPGAGGDRYRAAFLKGLDYLFAAEFPSGGWPQVYPLQGGYHDALTLNDDTMIKATALLQRAAAGTGDYGFVPAAVRARAGEAAARALATLLTTQVIVDGRRTIWAQQYDPLTRRPVAARNFEPIALATAESAAVLRFLMQQPDPSPAVRQAIVDGAAWFAGHAVHDRAWTAANAADGRRLVEQPGAPPLWARFYDPVRQTPVFGDRDRSIQDDVNAVSLERRNGYSWFSGTGAGVATAYAKWRRRDGG